MTLDNCIKWYSDEAEKLKDDNPEYAGQCKQIANWLTELKELRILIGGEDNYLTEPPEQADVQPVSKWMSDLCIVCGRDVRKDSTYYDINGATVCEGCMGVSCKVEKEG